jgi:hypothetical protein
MKIYNKILGLAILALGLSSCLKDDMVDSQKYGMINLNAVKVIEIPAASSRTETFSLPIQTAAQAVETNVHLAAEDVANEDIKVTISTAESQDLITKYNNLDANNDGVLDNSPLTLLPSTLYTLPNGLDVTIASGSKDVKFRLNVLTANFDPSKSYGIAVKLAKVDKSGYTISGNYGYKILIIGAKNAYDGVYDMKGYIVRNSASGPDMSLSGNYKGFTAKLITVDATKVQFVSQLWATGGGVGGIDGVTFTVDPSTKLVTCSASGNATLQNEPTYNNRYDSATKTFYVSFKWGASPNTRAATDTLTYSKSR